MKSANYRSLLLIGSVVAIIVIALTLVTKSKTNNQLVPTPVTIVTQNVEETDQNGVYTNNTYGFSFKYDNKVFSTSNAWDENGKRFFANRENPYTNINIYIQNIGREDQGYNLCHSLKIGQLFYDENNMPKGTRFYGNAVKLYEYNVDTNTTACISKAVRFKKVVTESEYSSGYTAIIPGQDKFIIVNMSPEGVIYKKIFDDIVKSFTFITR